MTRGSIPLSVLIVAGLGLALAGCSGLGQALGLSKRPPDEFEVVAKQPLTVPPDFNLRPPADEELSLKDQNPREMAYRALFPPRPTRTMPALPADDVSVNDLEGDNLDLDETGGFSDDIFSGESTDGQP
mgnify:CR=1 FL=1